jgi:hypothetical protein
MRLVPPSCQGGRRGRQQGQMAGRQEPNDGAAGDGGTGERDRERTLDVARRGAIACARGVDLTGLIGNLPSQRERTVGLPNFTGTGQGPPGDLAGAPEGKP